MNILQSQAPSVSLGGVVLPLASALIMQATASNGFYDSLKLNGVNYLVPVGYKLQILAFRTTSNGSATAAFIIGFSTAAANNGAVPTGYSDCGAGYGIGYTAASIGGYAESAVFFEVAAGNYATMKGAMAANVANTFFLCRLVAI